MDLIWAEAYLTAYQGDISATDDPQAQIARQQLRDCFASIEAGYHALHDQKDFRIHFHLPPARSLLRLWKKDQNQSDDLSSFRNTVLTLSRGSHDPITGIEIGRGGFAIRGIAPVTADDGRYLGSVEVLSSYDPLVQYSISNENEYIAVYMDRQFLPIATKLQDSQKHPIIGEDLVFVSSTNKDVTDALLTSDVLTAGLVGQAKLRQGYHQVTTFPIQDFSGQTIGIMAFVVNATDLYQTLSQVRQGVALLCLGLMLGIGIPLIWVLRHVTVPLNNMIRVISQGTQQVTKESNQVATASQSLAQGATEQAAGLQETSSSLEEISSMTKQNAEHAERVQSLASEARSQADQGAQTMERMQGAITSGSKKARTRPPRTPRA